MIEKNQIVTLAIEDMSEQGEGIGHVDGYTLLVKDAVIGDRVEAIVTKAGKTYGYGRIRSILEPSPDRIPAACPAAGPCGGCQLQSMSYEAQLKFKQRKVREHLRRIGGFADPQVEPVLGMEDPWHYRNKAQIPVGRDKDGKLLAGFYAGRSHRIVPCDHCRLGMEGSDEIRDIILKHMETYGISAYNEEKHQGLVRHILVRHGRGTGEWMVCIVINGRKFPHSGDLMKELRKVKGMKDVSFSVNCAKTNVIMGRELLPLSGPGYICEKVGNLTFQVSPLAFFQVNPLQTEVLYGKALEFAALTGTETVWDLYCGTGSISLFLAKKAGKVYGVEIIPQAVENARENARRNKIRNAEFFVGKAEEVVPEFYRKGRAEDPEAAMLHPDVMVVDPPRKGCQPELLETMLAMKPQRIVYVSCNSATLARDLKILCAEDYELQTVQPVDMFPQTVGVETVVRIVRKKA